MIWYNILVTIKKERPNIVLLTKISKYARVFSIFIKWIILYNYKNEYYI